MSEGAVLAPHFAATARRARGKAIVVAHDTTEFVFRRSEMGTLGEGRVGFLGHFALAVAVNDARSPLGVVALETLVRSEERRRRSSQRKRHSRKETEERRWWRGVEQAEKTLDRSGSAIHVMDREADSYELFAQMVAASCRFVIRTHYNRVTVPEGTERITRRSSRGLPKLLDALSEAPALLTVEVPVSARKAVTHTNKVKPPREARIATLQYAACKLTLARPTWAKIEGPPTLPVNVVQVREVNPPEGCDPVEWRLVTTEPVDTSDDVKAVIDAYRARWLIEEYFRALKQGCAYEKRQLENMHAIINALAVFVPIAWQLLAIRTLARVRPDAPAVHVIDRLKLQLLQRHPKVRLPATASARDAMLAIAKLGGHLKNNGEPGWIVLGRGYDKLLNLEEGALLMRQRSDQS